MGRGGTYNKAPVGLYFGTPGVGGRGARVHEWGATRPRPWLIA
jgi:hypothetical protein